MQIASELLHLLADGKFHSGTVLAEILKVSRSSVWKGIDFLKKLSVPIQAVTGKGYRWLNPIELLDKKKILEQVEPAFRDFRLDILTFTTSTNDYLMHRIAHHLPNPTVCIAEVQTKGRGRMGKEWISPLGASLYFSLYWRFPNKPYDLSGLSLVVGLAVLGTLKKIAQLPDGVGIKWPNDLWYKEAKLCGILLETLQANTHLHAMRSTDVVIGIGLNFQMKGLLSDSAWTDLQQVFGFVPSRNQVASLLINILFRMLQKFQQQGFSAFTKEWSHYDLLKNKTVSLRLGQSTELGFAEGVNERGELCVRIGKTLKAVRYGEISVRPENECRK